MSKTRQVAGLVLAASCICGHGLAADLPPDPLAYRPIPGAWPEPQPARALEDAEELAALVDKVMGAQLEGAYVPGAVVAIVKVNPEAAPLVFTKGYGLAHRDPETPVDPERTLFRVGSISKLFTWTALMQLVERGRVHLGTDINAYLGDFRVPATYALPVTPRNLLTHTAGFETNTYAHSAARHWCCLPSFEQTLRLHFPARVRPPAVDYTRGENAAYSNTALALAARIVERQSGDEQQSGERFDDYVDRHIFGPLQMTRSTFREPLPLRIRGDMSGGYRVSLREDGTPEYAEPGFEYLNPIGPATSASSTAGDMARFMIAHLQEGRYADGRILKPETARLMHSRAFSPHPQVNGSAFGFMEKHFNGRRAIWHQGTTIQFYAELYLLPAEGVGVFVAYNSEPPAEYLGELMKRFMDHYFPAVLPDLQPRADAAARALRYAGTYATTVRSHTTWEKRFLLEATLDVSATDCGLLIADYPVAGYATEWIELAEVPGVFRREDGEDTIAFSEGADGAFYFFGDDAFAPMVKLSMMETPRFDRAWLRFCSAGLVAAILVALLAAVRRKTMSPYRTTCWIAGVLGVVDLGILAGIQRTADWDTYDLLVALPWPLTAAMSLSLAAVPLTLVLLVAVARGWWRADWTVAARLGFTALAFSPAGILWWLYWWNLIGFRVA